VRIDLASGAVASAVPPHAAPVTPTAHLSTAAAPAAAAAPNPLLPGVPEPQFLSADGHYVLSSKRVADDPTWDKYLWTVYDRNTGQEVGSLRAHVRYAPFFVTGSRIVFETRPHMRPSSGRPAPEPLQIRAVDLGTGQALWSHPIRDTTITEPPPP